jgi:glucose dehydrogenase
VTQVLSKTSIKAFSITLLFFFSSIGGSILISTASAAPNSAAPQAATPLSLQEANWAYPNGNQFNHDYNPQNQINSSNAQYLGLAWLFPLPGHPTSLLNVGGNTGVDTAPLIINGTIYVVTQADQAFALNAANGNVLWQDILPIYPNSTIGKGIGALSLHLHDGNEQFTTKLFGNTPTWWISADDWKVYAINALNGKYELNFSVFDGVKTVAGNNPGSQYHGTGSTGILVDQNKGIIITSIISTNQGDSGRCFYRGWNILVTPPQLMWTAFCTPPQPGGNLPADPNWEVNQVNSMKGAEIFYAGPAWNAGGGPMPSTTAVYLKALSPSALYATLYNDWGYVNQSPLCQSYSSGASTGSTGAGWGGAWLFGTGPTAGMAFVNTNNKDPYAGPCTPGPDLWSAAVLALNVTTGQWIWGFQANAHELWDYDCSWWQALGNETVNGVNTQVMWKTCKAGYLFELNAVTGQLIWAWTPPVSIEPRCPYCFMLDPLNRTQMTQPFFNPNQLDPNVGTLCTPCTFSFESESAYSPPLNYIYVVSQNVPGLWFYQPFNTTNYHTSGGTRIIPVPAVTRLSGTNSTVEAVDAATGKMAWSHFLPTQGYRGGVMVSGNVLFLTQPSGDLVMLNAKTGALIKDYYIGGPLNTLSTIGATIGGQMELILPMSLGTGTWGTTVPGDIVALTLQNVGATNTVTIATTTTATTTLGGATTTITTGGAGSTVTTTVATTVATTIISTVSGTGGGANSSVLYGVASVAVIFIIATGYLAMRGRKPAS